MQVVEGGRGRGGGGGGIVSLGDTVSPKQNAVAGSAWMHVIEAGHVIGAGCLWALV